MITLGIESSCDETAIGIVSEGKHLIVNNILSSMNLHALYGGVVPEIAARSHIEAIIPLIESSLSDAKLTWNEIDSINVTNGAGLSGSLLIGVMTAKTLALTLQKPLYSINHVMSHVFANFLTSTSLSGYKMPSKPPRFPFLAIIVSGGHSQLVIFRDYLDYEVLGKTLDDAIGEAFDKVAKMLGLKYPGGVEVSKLALKGNKNAFSFPVAKVNGYDFSFSGLKTAVLRQAQKIIGEDYQFPSIKLSERLSESQKADLAASFEYWAIETIIRKVKLAILEYNPKNIVVAGGVAANFELRSRLSSLASNIEFPDPKLCTDNGAMVATLGYYLASNSAPSANPLTLNINPNLKM